LIIAVSFVGRGRHARAAVLQGLVAHRQVGRLAGLVVTLRGLVVGIQQVGDARLQAPLGGDAVFAAQIEGGVAGQLAGVGQIVVALSLGMQAGTDAEGA